MPNGTTVYGTAEYWELTRIVLSAQTIKG
jgi:hypothetical protein